MKIYLAGGFYSDWQKEVIRAAPKHMYFNPKDYWELTKDPGLEDLTGPDIYVPLDIGKIMGSDLIIVYAEANNPGAGYLFEMGYAAGIGVPYVFINEQKVFPEKYMEMYIWSASAYYTQFEWHPDSVDPLMDINTENFLEDVKTDGMEVFI